VDGRTRRAGGHAARIAASADAALALAGALKMSKKKFLVTFILSRGTRHAFAAWLGAYYGRHVLHLWNRFSARWATTILVVLWTTILVSCAIAIWKIYKTSRSVGSRPADLVKRSDTTV
jgi:hypothetical protein